MVFDTNQGFKFILNNYKHIIYTVGLVTGTIGFIFNHFKSFEQIKYDINIIKSNHLTHIESNINSIYKKINKIEDNITDLKQDIRDDIKTFRDDIKFIIEYKKN